MAHLELRNVEKRYTNGNEAVTGISFAAGKGEFVVLVGPSGCGKSTTLRMIAGLEEISSGDIMIGNKRVNDLEPKDRDVAMVFQNYALYPHLTVYENIAFPLTIRKASKETIDKEVRAAASLLSISKHLDRKPKELSGGERQRVALGRAIVRKPEVFLFDEPLSNLDAALRTEMRTELKSLQRRLGTTMVYVTHDQTEAMTMGDTIVVMNKGRIEQVGTPTEIYERPASIFVAKFLGAPAINLLEGKISRSDTGLVFSSGSFHLLIAHSDAIEGKDVVVGIRPESFMVEGDSLDETSAIRGTVVLVERLGSTTYCYLSTPLIVGGTLAVTLNHTSSIPSIGEHYNIMPHTAAIHIFDPHSGLRL